MHTRVLAILVLLVATLTPTARAETTYWRITYDRVTVVSNGSAERCSRLASQFLAFESILRDLAQWNSDFEPKPMAFYGISQADARRVLLSQAELRRQAAENFQIYSKYLPGTESNVAAIVDESGSDDPLQSVLLLYAEGLLSEGPTRDYPAWYQLGVANILNGLMIRSDGSVLLNRNVPFTPVDKSKHPLHQSYDLVRLLQTGGTDFSQGGDYGAFIATAREWAQYGLLTTPQRRSQYRELAVLMRQGTPAEEAVKDAFGIPLEPLSDEFWAHKWRYDVQYRLAPKSPAKPIPAATKLDPAEAEKLLQVLAARAKPSE